jgi:hypothetical protein
MNTKIKPRGLESIRSMSGMVTETTHPHRKFLKLAILAMEEARRGKERTNAQNRIENIDARMAEIRTESEGLLQVCNEIVNARNSPPPQKPDASRQAKRGFTLKY